jgi:hypothetical protein
LSSASIKNGVDPDQVNPRPPSRWTDEPFDLVRLAVGSLAILGTILAVILAIAARDPRMLEMVGALWAVYGLTVGFLSGVLEPVIDGFFQLVSNAGLRRVGSGFSGIETLEVQGPADGPRRFQGGPRPG